MTASFRALLAFLVAVGLLTSSRLAWREGTVGEACPSLSSVPACYIAFAAYLLMALGLVAKFNSRDGIIYRNIFVLGLAIAGGLALFGSVMELVQGDVCPRAGVIPMCYLSLAFCAAIGLLFWHTAQASAAIQG